MKKKIGKRIAEYRKKKGVTQEELSELVDISPHYLSALERGVYNIKLETLVKILNSIDCSADEVFCDVVKRAALSRSNKLYDRLKRLDTDEQARIFNVIETMIGDAEERGNKE